MKYPAIYKSVEGSEYLYQNKDSYYCYERQVWDSSEPHHDCHHSDTNITAEYLANTYGEVKSKEHAEFIVKLAEVNKIQAVNPWREGLLFCFYYNSDGDLILAFYPEKSAKSDGEKQITIPLPPECESVDEWPKVNDDVLVYDLGLDINTKGIYKGKNKKEGPIIELDDGKVILLGFEGVISKPKTPEQELQEDLINIFQSSLDGGHFVGKLMAKYNITKKGEGDE